MKKADIRYVKSGLRLEYLDSVGMFVVTKSTGGNYFTSGFAEAFNLVDERRVICSGTMKECMKFIQDYNIEDEHE